MSNDSETVRRRSWLANLFILFAILLGVTIVGLLVAWALTPKQSVATAMFRVSRDYPTIFEDKSAKLYDEQEHQLLKNSQLALLKSYFVLNAALRKPGISSLSAFAGKEDPEGWLSENLKAEYPEDGEYLEISLQGSESQMDDFVHIVNAVAQAYSDEVIFKERTRRATTKDLRYRSVEDLLKTINEKWETYYQILKDSGRHDEVTAATLRQINTDRLGRIDAELMRLEDEQRKQDGNSEKNDAKSYEKRISQLRERQAEMEKLLVQLTEPSVELDRMKAEIELLQGIADELMIQAQMMSIDSHAPQRIELVQLAEVSSAE